MIDLFTAHHASLIIFFPFIIIAALVFVNLLFAVVYQQYQDNLSLKLKEFYNVRDRGLRTGMNQCMSLDLT
jgi:hypothetical protein